jgi:peptidoglycan-associated lipoprotein
MLHSTIILRTVVAGAALIAVAGCAETAAPPPAVAVTSGPELAGAWYQVFFDTNSAAINERGRSIVGNVAYVVANNNTTRVTVIGKTDRVGKGKANMDLSQQRANSVRDALIAAGVPADRIDTSWTGERKQQVATANDAAESRNRVVDITVVKQPG